MDLEEKLYANKFERNAVGKALKSISNKWTFYILKDLYLGKSHFTEFQQNRPDLDNKALTRCLKSMENNNLIDKIVEYGEIKYVLTEKGQRLSRVFYELIVFAVDTNEEGYFTDEEIEFIKRTYKDILNL